MFFSRPPTRAHPRPRLKCRPALCVPDPFSPSMGPQPPPSHLPHHHQAISLGPAPPLSSNGAPPTPSGAPPSAAQATPKLPPTPSAGPSYNGPGGPGQGPGGQEGANGVAGEWMGHFLSFYSASLSCSLADWVHLCPCLRVFIRSFLFRRSATIPTDTDCRLLCCSGALDGCR